VFERFHSQFRLLPAAQEPASPWDDARLAIVTGYEQLMASYAGASFENGLYRLHSSATGPAGQQGVEVAFPEYARRLVVFAFDWLGRQFALDLGRLEGGEALVTMLEPGTGEALEIPADFLAFHEQELIDYRDAALASDFFASWAAANPEAVPLDVSRCVGYRVPLFLGGRDSIDNLEVTDFDVYWTVAGQLRVATRNLPTGTSIQSVQSEPDQMP
jgi:hypothetical protein